MSSFAMAPAGQGAPPGKETKAETTYQVAEQLSPVVREEEFAKQLRIARYLAGASLPAARLLETAAEGGTPKSTRGTPKTTSKTKAKPAKQKADQVEFAKEKLRAGRAGLQKSQSGRRRTEDQRRSPAR